MRPTMLLCALLAASLPARGDSFFPYEIHKKTLANGLDVVIIPTPEFRDVLSYNLLVLAGSRNEAEKGKTGLAHLFEHIAFRHRYEDAENSYRSRIETIGAFDNAWTWFDVTYYHPVTFARHLDALLDIQAERFVAMDFSERIYRTEAGAVLGEYRRIASDPSQRMNEVLADIAYGASHGYGHTTLGYLDDIRNMPSTYEAGKAFYETYYRPNNCVVFVVGDVVPDEVMDKVEKTHGEWKRGEIPKMSPPAPLNGPKRGYVEWESSVAPRIIYAHRVPPCRPGTRDAAIVAISNELVSGRTSPLYQKLRYEKKTVTSMSTSRMSAEGFHDRLLETTVRLDQDLYAERGAALLAEIEGDLETGFTELASFSERPGAGALLASIRSKYRYDLLASLGSPHDIAGVLSWYYRFDRDEHVLEKLVAAVEKLTPQDIDAFAAENFTAKRRAIVTMTPKASEEKGGTE